MLPAAGKVLAHIALALVGHRAHLAYVVALHIIEENGGALACRNLREGRVECLVAEGIVGSPVGGDSGCAVEVGVSCPEKYCMQF